MGSQILHTSGAGQQETQQAPSLLFDTWQIVTVLAVSLKTAASVVPHEIQPVWNTVTLNK